MRIPSQIRTINKYSINHLTGAIARAGWGPFAIIYHTGRRSGREYATPLIVVRTGEGFVIALTYGPEVDWYRNVTAAGRCQILWHRQVYEIDQIAPLETEAGWASFPPFEGAILRLVGIREFIRLHAASSSYPDPA